jgi:hypothetical protein
VGGLLIVLGATASAIYAQQPVPTGKTNAPAYRLVLPGEQEKNRTTEREHAPVYRLVLPEDPPSRPSEIQPSSPTITQPGDRLDSRPGSTSGNTNRRQIPEIRLEAPARAPAQPEIHPAGLPAEASPSLAPLPATLIPGPRPATLQAGKDETARPPLPSAYVEPLEVPGPERLFRLESEQQLRERIRQEQRDHTSRAVFPADMPIAAPSTAYQGRDWPRLVSTIPAPVTRYQPLYFEDKNVERYGWDAGIFQPFLSAGKFYLDLALLPYNLGAQPPWSLEYNAGYGLPGDPEPYRLYLPRCSVTGASLESLAVLGIIALP